MLTLIYLWRQLILERPDLVGGTIEHNEGPHGIFCGPIIDLQVVDSTLTITTAWTALRRSSLTGETKSMCRLSGLGSETFMYVLDDRACFYCRPRPLSSSQGGVYFLFWVARVTLYPKDAKPLPRPSTACL